jgi:hypothetical protein
MLRGFVTVLIAAAIATIISFVLNSFHALFFANWYLSLAFFSALCIFLNIVYAFQARSKSFTQLLVFSLSLKLLLAFVAVFVYSFISISDFVNFSIHFLLHYLIFTIMEINYLLYLIRNNQVGKTKSAP